MLLNIGKTYTVDKNNILIQKINPNANLLLYPENLNNKTASCDYDSHLAIAQIPFKDLLNFFIVLDQDKTMPANVKILLISQNRNLVGWLCSWLFECFVEVKQQ